MLGQKTHTSAKNITFGQFKALEGNSIYGHSPMMDFFFELWTQKGGHEKVISRADISPQEMKDYLEHIVLMDVFGSGKDLALKFRLMGSHAAGSYGELTGKDVNEMENTQAADRIYEVSRHVLEKCAPILTIVPGYSPKRLYMEATALYMPLFNDQKQVSKIMVCVNVATPKEAV